MTNYEAGAQYEEFIEIVYKAILEAEMRSGNIGHISIERGKKIISKSGTPAEIDIYWEYKVAGIKNSVAIECRNWNKNVDIPGVRDFARKISDISGLKGLMVTKKGFSPNAVAEASADKIDLLIIREPKEKDWEGWITKYDIFIHIQHPSYTTSITTSLNKEWAINNGYTEGSQPSLNVRNDQLIFEDPSDSFRHSLIELEQNGFFEDKGIGDHVWVKYFNDGWMIINTNKYKLDQVKVKYTKPQTRRETIEVNFEKYVLAIMEYVNGDCGKSVVLTNGTLKAH